MRSVRNRRHGIKRGRKGSRKTVIIIIPSNALGKKVNGDTVEIMDF